VGHAGLDEEPGIEAKRLGLVDRPQLLIPRLCREIQQGGWPSLEVSLGGLRCLAGDGRAPLPVVIGGSLVAGGVRLEEADGAGNISYDADDHPEHRRAFTTRNLEKAGYASDICTNQERGSWEGSDGATVRGSAIDYSRATFGSGNARSGGFSSGGFSSGGFSSGGRRTCAIEEASPHSWDSR
jgi:uncharacterized membrane protein YgcG